MKSDEEIAMLCDRFQSELREAGAGAPSSPALQGHLASCAACRARFAAEQNLYASIDSNLRAAVNAEAPVHLTASIRARLAGMPASSRIWNWLWVPAAFSAAAVASLFLVTKLSTQVENPPQLASDGSANPPLTANSGSVIPPEPTTHPRSHARVLTVRNAAQEAEVTVLPTVEKLAMVRLVRGLQSGVISPSPLVGNSGADLSQEINVRQITVESLQIQPLEGEAAPESEQSTQR
jgi:hypothetical protein